ncbi:hypothetical protein FB451DRAFT_1378633 [Mycena latifolia]|nr:hypothetical protein FB451DRAFT_1378633 [Mycena latifolia]
MTSVLQWFSVSCQCITGIPELFRSYDTPEEPAFDCRIWEAARATSATPGLLKPMEIGWGAVRPKYIGGGVWNNNPTSLVVTEAQKMYPSQPVVLVVSVGSGHPDTIQIPRSPSLTAFPKTLKGIATDCERIHEDNARRFSPNTYFRLNVLQGLQGFEQQHWGRSGEVSAHTRVYLGTEDAKSKLTSAVNVILNPVVRMSDSPAYLKVCPPPSVRFTGREDILLKMSEYFNTSIGQRHIFLLHGLGGSGKSQIAFKFVAQSTSRPESRFPDVYFVDSSSQQTIENDLATLALAKKVGKTLQDSLLWLSNQHTEWLIVFNNADDINLNLVQYFPSGSHGNILVTSRNPDLSQLAQATHKVEQMALEEAISLLLSAAHYDIMEITNRDVGKRIVQAGAYISSSRGLQKYLDLYEQMASRMQLLDQKPPQSEYGWSVYATWQISFDNLSSQARDLLQLCAFSHHDGITEDIFQQATLYQITPDGPTEVDLQEPLGFLAKFLDRTGSKWDSLKFIAVTNELGRFSLIDFQAASGDITFSIHPLVHEWCRTIVKVDAPTELCMHKLIGMSLASRRNDFRFSHKMFPHLDALLFKTSLDSSREPNILDSSFASQCLWVYHPEGKWGDGVRLGESMLHTPVSQLDEDQTLRIQGTLAVMYANSGAINKGRELAELVLNKRRELLGENHRDTLWAMDNLALRYSQMGQVHKAAELEKVVLSKRKELLGEDHPDTLRAMGNLATRYLEMGQVHEAAELKKVVFDKRRDLLGEDHPDTLMAMESLAISYSKMGQFHQAVELVKVVLSKHRELLGEDHPYTLRTMGNLAGSYSEMGQTHEAAELEKVVLSKRTELLGKDHPDTLMAMGNLAVWYSQMGQFLKATEFEKLQDGAELEKVVLNKRRELLGQDHPDSLWTLANLGFTYFQMGHLAEARELQEQAFTARRRVLGEGHPDTIRTANQLAATIEQLEGAAIAHEPRRETEPMGLASEMSDQFQHVEGRAGGSTPLGSIREKLRIQQMCTGKVDADSHDAEETERQSGAKLAEEIFVEDRGSLSSTAPARKRRRLWVLDGERGDTRAGGTYRSANKREESQRSASHRRLGRTRGRKSETLELRVARGDSKNIAFRRDRTEQITSGGSRVGVSSVTAQTGRKQDIMREGTGIMTGRGSEAEWSRGGVRSGVRRGVETAYGTRRRCETAVRPSAAPSRTPARLAATSPSGSPSGWAGCAAAALLGVVVGADEKLAGAVPVLDLAPLLRATELEVDAEEAEVDDGKGRDMGRGDAEMLDEHLRGGDLGGARGEARDEGGGRRVKGIERNGVDAQRSDAEAIHRDLGSAVRDLGRARGSSPPHQCTLKRREDSAHAPHEETLLREGGTVVLVGVPITLALALLAAALALEPRA